MKKIIELKVNGVKRELLVAPNELLINVLRDQLGLTGTKYGCGSGYCGSCTVHLDGEATRSCVTAVENAAGKSITTIEGLAAEKKNPVLEAWIHEDVPQCGYCQPGQIMTAAALLKSNPSPRDSDIDAAMASTLCRCGTYPRIKRAIQRASKAGKGGAK